MTARLVTSRTHRPVSADLSNVWSNPGSFEAANDTWSDDVAAEFRAIGYRIPSEIWLPCPGYEDRYSVSDAGNVRATRKGGGILKTPLSGDGYPRVCLRRLGFARVITVHRLVALAFHGDKRNALHCEVAHLDGNRANARADNLKWVSKVENHSHKRLHGTHQAGEKHPRAKLTADQVREIRSSPDTNVAMARKFGIAERTVRDIRSGRRWRSLLGQSAIAVTWIVVVAYALKITVVG